MINKPIREREFMPEVSFAADKTLSKFPDYNEKQFFTPKKEKPIIKTCKICKQSYDEQSANNILSKLPTIKDFDYINTCLDCIKKTSHKSKILKNSKIIKLNKKLNTIKKIYGNIYIQSKKELKEYKALDYQENIITHQQKMQAEKEVATTKKTSKKTKSNKALAEEILAKLTPEQREAVLANLNK